MKNSVSIILNQPILGKNFKIYGTAEEPLFLAKDVAKIIGHSDRYKMIKLVDEDERVKKIVPTPGGRQESWLLKENGLFEILMQSRKPIAKSFKEEIKIILKSIRKNGLYIKDNILESMISSPDFAMDILIRLKDERDRRKQLASLIEKQKPMVLFAQAIGASNTTILIGELAKILKQNGADFGQNRLFKWLRDNNYLIKRKGPYYNTPTQRAMNLGLFRVREYPIVRNDGKIEIYKLTTVTPKGQYYFINKFLY